MREREKNPNWKGGKYISSQGYVLMINKHHPNCDGRGYVPEHTLVMEYHLGRYLTKYEIVHHINGNKLDNRLENLRLMKDSEHRRYHFLKDKNPRWNNGIKIHRDGYIMIYAPDHPHCTPYGYIMKHRLIMEKYLKRYLSYKERVYHINGDKTDNRIENLSLTKPKKLGNEIISI